MECSCCKLNWIDPLKRKPEGKIFWALTDGRHENHGRDWTIRKLINDSYGDYRTLDYAGSYSLPDTYNGQTQFDTIHGWLPLEYMPINDKEFCV